LLIDIAGDIIGEFIPDLSPKSKFEKHVSRLKEEAWFSTLEKDYRYGYIIFQNSKVKRFLSSERNVKMVLNMEEEKEKFISLIKEEHSKFTKLY
jgi:hypothetical protein